MLSLIKPIDTQILYPQTPELANRQHSTNQVPAVQQDQFAHIMQKEAKIKQDTIAPTPKSENLKTEKDSQRQKENPQFQKREQKNNQNKKPKQKQKAKNTNRIDIRI